MITSDRQLKTTLEKVKALEESLKLKPGITNSSLIRAAQMQTTSLIEELKQKVDEYNNLKSIGLDAIKISSPEDMMLLPIRYRIAKHMTQEVFAKSVDVSLRMITRYEAEEYRNITGETLKKILNKIPLKILGKLKEA